jgi:hypothetical protein
VDSLALAAKDANGLSEESLDGAGGAASLEQCPALWVVHRVDIIGHVVVQGEPRRADEVLYCPELRATHPEGAFDLDAECS